MINRLNSLTSFCNRTSQPKSNSNINTNNKPQRISFGNAINQIEITSFPLSIASPQLIKTFKTFRDNILEIQLNATIEAKKMISKLEKQIGAKINFDTPSIELKGVTAQGENVTVKSYSNDILILVNDPKSQTEKEIKLHTPKETVSSLIRHNWRTETNRQSSKTAKLDEQIQTYLSSVIKN